MTEIKILIEGYAKPLKNGWLANSSVVFIKSNGKNIIADPGFDREKLLSALKKEKLKTSDIDFVFLTHGHIDHSLLSGIFEKAKIVDELYIYQKDIIIKHNGIIPNTDLKVIRTPGHMEEHCSLIVETKKGVYAVAGDVFWWLENEKQEIDISKPDNDPEHMNLQKLIVSRKKILKLADYIIPGHGKMFRVKK
ncbi:MAG: MBL fold metallo-hydrolase [Patescibacteria group bacterium]|nr:MBL fold metallo-hydrolase [Patescibacteria group bacterium]MDD5164008.1 MBL fold metallo-hydrolase [Patescibacteria group bacterium]MDD5534908.1 MBL fold metallo-hydrolase [Patescibacteria group bacterium]